MAIGFIEEGIVSFSEKIYSTKVHAHYAIELAFARSGFLNISTGDQHFNNIQAAIIASNTPHTFDCLNGECFLYFIDPTTNLGEYLTDYYDLASRQMVVLGSNEIDRYKNGAEFSLPEFAGSRPKKISERTAKCLRMIESQITEEDLSVGQLAQKLFVSESRLAHLFKAEMGISIRQYILWKKMELAAIKAIEGLSLTKSAHLAGFTDSSHFIKVFRKMFGVKPFFVLKG